MGQNKVNLGIITQARISSSRLPKKVLLKINGESLLSYHVSHLRESKLPIIVAISDEPGSEDLINECESLKVPYILGPTDDVLSRFVIAAKSLKLTHIIRVTSDCPLIDGEILAQAADIYKKIIEKEPRTYYSNALKRTFPRGMDFEIFSMEMLLEADAKGLDKSEREHVTPYIYKNAKEFNLVDHISTNDSSNFRLTVDTAEDFELIKEVIEKHGGADKSSAELVSLLRENPDLVKINSEIEQKKI